MAQAILDIEIKGIKEAKVSMDGLSESIIKVEQTQKELIKTKKNLEKTIASNEKQQQELNNAYAKGEITQNNYELASQAVTASTEKATKELVANKTAIVNNKAQLADLNKEHKQAARLVNAEADTLDELRRKLALAQTEYGKLDQSTEEGRIAAEKFAAKINDLNKEVKEAEASIGDHRRNVGNYGDAVKDVLPFLGSFGQRIGAMQAGLSSVTDGLKGATEKITMLSSSGAQAAGNVGGLKGAFAAVTGGIAGATRAAIAFISTGIGAAIAGLAAAGAAIVGLTRAFADYNAEVAETNTLISGITNESGELVDKLRVQSGAMSNVLGVEQEKLVEGAKVLVQQFGISYEEALAKMQSGILATNGANEEFMDSIREYSTFFSDAGYSVDEFNNIINAGFDLGIYSDKLPDAIKEADISLREMTSTTRDALVNAFGEEFAAEIADGVNTGALTTKQALELMSTEAEKVGLNAEQAATLTADVFRGAGEDAGGALAIFDAVNVSLQEQTAELDENGKRMQEDIERQAEVAEARDRALNSPAFRAFSKVMKDIGAFLKKVFYGAIEAIGKVIDFSIIKPFNMVKAVVNGVINVFKGIMIGIGKLIMKFEPLKKAVNAVKAGFSSLVDGFKKGFATIRATLNGLSAYGKAVLGQLGEALDAIGKGQFKKAKKAIQDIGDEGAKAYDRAFNKAMDEAMGKGVDTVEESGNLMEDILANAGASAGAAFRDEFMEKYDAMKNDIARKPVLIQAQQIFDNRDMDELEEKLDLVTEKFASGEWTEGTMVNLSRLDNSLTGVTVSAAEYYDLVEGRIKDIHREEEKAANASSRRSAERAREREKELADMLKRLETLGKIVDAEIERNLTEEELLDKRFYDKLRELDLDKDITEMTATELAAREALYAKYNDDLAELRQKNADDEEEKTKETFEKNLKAIEDGLALELLMKETAMLNELRNAQLTEEQKLQLQKDFQAESLQLQRDALIKQIELIESTLGKNETTAALEQLRKALAGINLEIENAGKDDDGTEKSLAERLGLTDEQVEKIDKGIKGVEAGLSAMSQMTQANAAERLARVDQMLEQGVINEEEAERKKERIKRDAARKQQKIDTTQAVINTAKAVTAALNTQPFLPTALIMAGIAAAQGAAQIKMIRSQQFAKGGILNGPSHAQGGIPMFSKGGAFYGEAEGGEAVLTKGVMKNPALASMASALNVAGGGVPFFAQGGVLEPIQSATPTDRAADIIASGLKSRQPVLVVEQLRERENSVDVIESLRTIG